jgi:hypothetical protein
MYEFGVGDKVKVNSKHELGKHNHIVSRMLDYSDQVVTISYVDGDVNIEEDVDGFSWNHGDFKLIKKSDHYVEKVLGVEVYEIYRRVDHEQVGVETNMAKACDIVKQLNKKEGDTMVNGTMVTATEDIEGVVARGEQGKIVCVQGESAISVEWFIPGSGKHGMGGKNPHCYIAKKTQLKEIV